MILKAIEASDCAKTNDDLGGKVEVSEPEFSMFRCLKGLSLWSVIEVWFLENGNHTSDCMFTA